MKKMLVSDYDGTLKTDVTNLKLNIRAIQEFRANGNVFILSTGRPFNSIIKEINQFNVPYDYLTCNDGAVIFSSDNDLLSANFLSYDDYVTLYNSLKNQEFVKEIMIYDTHGRNANKIVGDNTVVEIAAKIKKFRSIKSHISTVKETVPTAIVAKIYDEMFIKNNTSKSTGIEHVLDIMGESIDKENIYTVGDNSNDIEMLKDYNGYKMLTSYPCLYLQGLKTCREVHRLIKKINR